MQCDTFNWDLETTTEGPHHVEGIGYACLVAITPNWSPAGELGSSQEGETKESACSRSAESVGAGRQLFVLLWTSCVEHLLWRLQPEALA